MKFAVNDRILFCAGYPRVNSRDYDESGKRIPGVQDGDSGGPLVCPVKDNPEVWLQFGVVHGIVGEQGGAHYRAGRGPTFYARVSFYAKWILDQHSKSQFKQQQQQPPPGPRRWTLPFSLSNPWFSGRNPANIISSEPTNRTKMAAASGGRDGRH